MKDNKIFYLVITTIIVLSVILRIVIPEANFAPMGALALFAVAFYKRSYLAFIIPALAWWLSDLYLNNFVYTYLESFTLFTWDQFFSVLALAGIVGLGTLLFKKLNIATIAIGSISASLIFFVVSNFGVWMQGMLYPKTITGLIECYTMALPFYKATFISDMVFTSVFFGAMYLYSKTADAPKAALNFSK